MSILIGIGKEGILADHDHEQHSSTHIIFPILVDNPVHMVARQEQHAHCGSIEPTPAARCLRECVHGHTEAHYYQGLLEEHQELEQGAQQQGVGGPKGDGDQA